MRAGPQERGRSLGDAPLSGTANLVGRVRGTKSDYAVDVRPSASHQFVENLLYLMTLGPRHDGFSVLANTKIDKSGAQALADATENCWEAILDRDIKRFGRYFRAAFEVALFFWWIGG